MTQLERMVKNHNDTCLRRLRRLNTLGSRLRRSISMTGNPEANYNRSLKLYAVDAAIYQTKMRLTSSKGG